MADDILGNMSNMSIDELGSSLLQKQEEQRKAAAKKSKKNERIQQGLALLLMGQGVMKTQLKKRIKEAEDFHKFDTLNAEDKARKLNVNATILNTIGNKWDGKGGYEGFKNSEDYLGFSQAVRPFIDQKIKAMTADEYDTVYGTSTYENAINLATEGYAKNYLDTDKKSGKANYLAYEDGLRELLGDEAIDLDKQELFQRAMGLDADTLTMYKRKNYQNILTQYKAQGNLMGGFKRVLGLFNDDFKNKNGFDIFQKFDESTLAGPTIRDLNQAMNLKGMTNNIVSKALADASKSDTRWKERAAGKKFEAYRKDISEIYLPQMTNLIEEGRYPSELEAKTFINKGNWEEFMRDISEEDRRNLVMDTAALSLRLKEDRKFLESVYNETEGKKADGRSFNEFRAILDDEANRSMFAAMIVTDAGFRDESWNPFNWKDETYDSFGTLNQVYNKYNISNMIGDGINVDKRGKVSLPESYIEASKERKQDMLKSTVRDILKTSKTENERNIKLGGELDSEINKNFGMDSQAFIEMLAQEEMTFDKPSRTDLEKVGFANMFGSDNLDFQFPFRIKSEINRLNKILDEGNISKNNKIKLEEQVNILERSLLYLENKPEPESKESKKIKELQKKLEQERDDLRPTEINRIENQIQDLLKIEDSDEKKKKDETPRGGVQPVSISIVDDEPKAVQNKAKIVDAVLTNVDEDKPEEIKKNRLIPINIRQMMYDIFGGDEDVTEEDLSGNELQALRSIITPEVLRKGKLEYADYGTTEGNNVYSDVGGGGQGSNPIAKSFSDPAYALKTTLGQARVFTDKNGNVIIEDRYNFNDADDQVTFDSFLDDLRAIKSDWKYFLPRKTAKYFGSKEGEGSKILINLGKLDIGTFI